MFVLTKPVCFTRALQGSVGTGVQVLSVSHSGIKLLKTVKSSAAAPDYFRVLRPYTCVHSFSGLSLLNVFVPRSSSKSMPFKSDTA